MPADHRGGTTAVEQRPLDAYDLLLHLPRVTAAEPDAEALARAPEEVRRAFADWRAVPADESPL